MRNGLAFAAGLIGGLWIDTVRRTRAAAETHPPLGRFVDADGVRLHYLERGHGRPEQLEAAGAQTAALIPGVARLAPRYPELRVPLTIMAGTEDRIVGHLDHAARLHRDVPGSTLHLLSGTGHMVNHWRTDEVLEALGRLALTNAQTAAQANAQTDPVAIQQTIPAT